MAEVKRLRAADIARMIHDRLAARQPRVLQLVEYIEGSDTVKISTDGRIFEVRVR